MSAFTNLLAKCLVKTPYAGLPNILANKMVVPELIQANLTPSHFAREMQRFINEPQYVAEIKDVFNQMHQTLSLNSSERAAKAIMELIDSCNETTKN